MTHPQTQVGELRIDEVVRRLAYVIHYYRGRGASTHERTKEVWEALQVLLYMSEKSWDEWIPLIAKRYTPSDIGSKDAEYFEKHLLELLRMFAREAKGASPRMKTELAKIIRDALDASVREPFPDICNYVKEFHPDALEKERFKECKEVVSK
ncbi:MAG: hypothetical protein QXW41_07675 [Fervidicoccaceae archaeon]